MSAPSPSTVKKFNQYALTFALMAVAVLVLERQLGGRTDVLPVIALLFLLMGIPPMPAYLISLPLGRKVMLLLLTAAMLAGQHWRKTGQWFPFVHWAMYTRVAYNKEVIAYRFRAWREDGSSFMMGPETFMADTLRFGNRYYFALFIVIAEARDNPQNLKAGERVDAIIRSFAKMYEKRNPGESPLTKVEILEWRREPRHGAEKRESVVREVAR